MGIKEILANNPVSRSNITEQKVKPSAEESIKLQEIKKLEKEIRDLKAQEEKEREEREETERLKEIKDTEDRIAAIKELKEKVSKAPEQTGFKLPPVWTKFILPAFVIIFNILGLIAILVFGKSLMGNLYFIVLVFYAAIAMPLFLGGAVYSIFMLIVSWNKIRNALIPVASISKKFIVANFFLTHRRVLKRICTIDSDGISFKIGDCRYIIDTEKCYFDEDNFPSGYWMPNIPNQLGLDFAKYLDKATALMHKGEFMTDDTGNKVDIVYSSKNLEKLKQDKVFFEFHDKKITPQYMQLLIGAFILVGVAIAAIIIIVVVTKK